MKNLPIGIHIDPEHPHDALDVKPASTTGADTGRPTEMTHAASLNAFQRTVA